MVAKSELRQILGEVLDDNLEDEDVRDTVLDEFIEKAMRRCGDIEDDDIEEFGTDDE